MFKTYQPFQQYTYSAPHLVTGLLELVHLGVEGAFILQGAFTDQTFAHRYRVPGLALLGIDVIVHCLQSHNSYVFSLKHMENKEINSLQFVR